MSASVVPSAISMGFLIADHNCSTTNPLPTTPGEIITIHDGRWKLYLNEPGYLSKQDLNPDWVDAKWPNGTTIIARTEQANAMEYPGIVPKRFENPLPLFNLSKDLTESVDLTGECPHAVKQPKQQYERFVSSLSSVSDSQ